MVRNWRRIDKNVKTERKTRSIKIKRSRTGRNGRAEKRVDIKSRSQQDIREERCKGLFLLKPGPRRFKRGRKTEQLLLQSTGVNSAI